MKEIACESGVELLTEYLEGALAPDVRAVLDAHVTGCPKCRAFIASYRETPRIMRTATATELSAELQQTLRAFLRAQRRQS